MKYILAILTLKYITAAEVHAAKIENFVNDYITSASGALNLDVLDIRHVLSRR